MKTFKTYIFTILLLTGCFPLIKPEVTFIIKNETTSDLSISTFQKSKQIDSVYIKKGEEYKLKRKYSDRSIHRGISPFSSGVDSLVIRFHQDEKVIVHYCYGRSLSQPVPDPDCIPTKNVMNFNDAKVERGKNKKSTRTIVIEQSDYDKAVLP